jgi:hypothetical protein
MNIGNDEMIKNIIDAVWQVTETSNEENELINGILEFIDEKGRIGDIEEYSDCNGNSGKVQELKDLLENLEPMLKEPSNSDEQVLINDLTQVLEN